MERILKIYEQYEDYDRADIDNRIVKGLNILSKYTNEVSINPGHDEIFAGLKDEEYEKMTDEDIHEMFKMGWMVDEDSFSIFA